MPTPTRSTHETRAATAAAAEALEPRRLMSGAGTATLVGDHLTVTGTRGDDEIVIFADHADADRIVVTLGGVEIGRFTFDLNDDNYGFAVYAGRGADRVTIEPGTGLCTLIYGGPGDDTITGGDGSDSVFAGAGDDVVYGNGEFDAVDGQGGDDLIYGGDYQDNLLGGAGRDTLVGGGGDDRLEGAQDNDLLVGGDGDDTLYGYSGNDRLYGGDGADALYGEAGRDLLDGGAGADRIRGAAGRDRFSATDADAEKRDRTAADAADVLG
jgi:Ca2+-binding RTX toxin-like protein